MDTVDTPSTRVSGFSRRDFLRVAVAGTTGGAFFLATGCSSGSSTSAGPATTSGVASTSAAASSATATAKAKTLSLEFWSSAQGIKDHLAVIDEFEKKYNGKVNAQYPAHNAYFSKLATQVAGGSAPDVFQLNQDQLTTYLAKDVVKDL